MRHPEQANKPSPYYATRHTLVVLWIGAFLAFHLAWTAHPAAAFTLNGFDLAEQVSVHPGIRAETPPLRTAVFLWMAIPVSAAGLALTALLYQQAAVRWMLRGGAFLMALRVIPPQNELRDMLHNDHGLGLLLLTVGGIGFILLTIVGNQSLLPHMRWLEVGLCVIGVLFPALGYHRAFQLLRELNLAVSIGAGSGIYLILLLFIVGVMQKVPAGDSGQQTRAAIFSTR